MSFLRSHSWSVLIACFSLVWVFLLWFSVQKQIIVVQPVSLESDAGHYVELGVSLAEHGKFSLDGSTPFFEREPGYSVFLAVIYFFFGARNHVAALIVQTILYVGSSLVFVRSLRRTMNDRSRTILLAILLLYPSILHTMFAFTRENVTLSVAMLLASVCIELFYKKQIRFAIMAGVLLGYAMLLYSPFLLLLLFLIPVLLFWRVKFVSIALLCLTAVLVVSPWAIRNKLETGNMCLTGCYRAALQWHVRGEQSENIRGLEPAKCLWAEYISRDWSNRSEYCSFNAVWHRQWPEGFIGVPEDAAISAEGQRKILAHFGPYLWFSVFEVIELHLPYVNGWGTTYNIFAALSTIVLFVGILAGIPHMRRKEYVLFGAFVLYTIGVFALTDATPRYLIPVIFCYALVAAVGYDRVLSRLWKQ